MIIYNTDHNTKSRIIKSLLEGNAFGVMLNINGHQSCEFVWYNQKILYKYNILPKCVMIAYTEHNINNAGQLSIWHELFENNIDDIIKIRGPVPQTEIIYRGVAGDDDYRDEDGFSWTGDKERAIWYAKRFPELENPQVLVAKYDPNLLIFYTNDRTEDEYVMWGSDLEVIDRINVTR